MLTGFGQNWPAVSVVVSIGSQNVHRILFDEPHRDTLRSFPPRASHCGSSHLNKTSRVDPVQNTFGASLKEPFRSGWVRMGIIPASRSLTRTSPTWGGIP